MDELSILFLDNLHELLYIFVLRIASMMMMRGANHRVKCAQEGVKTGRSCCHVKETMFLFWSTNV